MSPTIAPTMGLTVAYSNPDVHGRPAFESPATIFAVNQDGSCNLNVQMHGGLQYIESASRGSGPGQWQFLSHGLV
jgi:hypothetical protein